MTFGDEDKPDATVSAELAALIEKARADGVPQEVHLEMVVAAFYRRHGRVVPSPFVLPEI